MAVPIVMDEPMITGMVNDKMAQSGIPSLRVRRVPPFRIAVADEPVKEGRNQIQLWIHAEKTRVSATEFRKRKLVHRLRQNGDRIDPKRERTRFERFPHCLFKSTRFNSTQCPHSSCLFGSRLRQAARCQNFRGPFLNGRPRLWPVVAPVGIGAFPSGPRLFSSKVFVGVVNQGVEPALSASSRHGVRRAC